MADKRLQAAVTDMNSMILTLETCYKVDLV